MDETSVPIVKPKPEISDKLLELVQFEIAMMTGPESDALYLELQQVIIRKSDGDRYRGNHAAAFGAACRLVLKLIRNVGADADQQKRLKALAIGMLRREWDADKTA